MRFGLRSLFVLVLFAALGSLALRRYLNSRPVVGQVIGFSPATGLVEVSIGAEDGAFVGQSLDMQEGNVLWCRARIVLVHNDSAVAEVLGQRSSVAPLGRCDKVVLRRHGHRDQAPQE